MRRHMEMEASLVMEGTGLKRREYRRTLSEAEVARLHADPYAYLKLFTPKWNDDIPSPRAESDPPDLEIVPKGN